MTSATARVLQVVRAGYGTALLLLPGPTIRLCTGRPAGHRTRNVARLLGARHLVQAAVTAGSGPSAESLGAGAAIDLTHAASMAALALADRRVRRVILTDALIETAFAAAGLSSAVPPRIGPLRDELREPTRAEALARLAEAASHGTITLLTATKDAAHSQAAVLAGRLLADPAGRH